MTSASPLHIKHLVLVGGGHAHALCLRMAAMNPVAGLRITLVTDVLEAPYSGMLPGHVAGSYSHDEAHIDLYRLAEIAGARIIHAPLIGIHAQEKKIELEDRPALSYDLLSLNTGSLPDTGAITGAEQYAVTAKPVEVFLQSWERFCQKCAAMPSLKQVIVIGGGAGGVELALSMKARLGEQIEIKIFHRSEVLLPQYGKKLRDLVESALDEQGVEVHCLSPVVEIKSQCVTLESGVSHTAQFIVQVTEASAPTWLANSGLKLDEKGFLLVDRNLRSSDPHIFGAGDVASVKGYSRPKSGVYAVRMAPTLWKNLKRSIQGRRLTSYRPQKGFLSLIGVGDGTAIASKGKVVGRSEGWWSLKDKIDRRFMNRFSRLSAMQVGQENESKNKNDAVEGWDELAQIATMRCLGCAAKVGSGVLEKALTRLNDGVRPPSEDAAVFQLPGQTQVSAVQSVDYLPALVSDPFLFGQIAANHCLSDLHAMGARVLNVLPIALIPQSADHLIEEDLFQMLAGVKKQVLQCGAEIAGGHTAESAVLALGLSCNGSIEGPAIMRKGGLKEGQFLVLTKPLGVGTIFAAAMRGLAPAEAIEDALHWMRVSNFEAAKVLQEQGVSCCTDVTGFGLLGHLVEMMEASALDGLEPQIELDLMGLPLLRGASKLSAAGIRSSLYPQNARLASVIDAASNKDVAHYPLLFDPQTSGGLLAAVDTNRLEDCLAGLEAVGGAWVVGQVGEFVQTAAVSLSNNTALVPA